MTKVRTFFSCQACGFESSKWLGRCPDCGDWNSFVEERQELAAPPGKGRPEQATLPVGPSSPKPFDAIDSGEESRVSSGIDEFDRVLGGGIVPGSLVLIGGEPGIGKSTLILQVAHLLGRTHGTVLYVSGEESERQVKLRGERLGISGGGLFLLAETSLERILEQVEALKPAALVVDSVQTVFSSRFPSAPGSISQVREVATQLLFLAKGRGVTTFLIGHVTKDGSIAGPKSLEHIVDTVLYFEGEKRQHHRIVRAVKNRFGAVSELGVFEMTGAGLKPVANPSALFLSERQAGAPGSAVVCTIEGSRPMLVEVQALVSPTSFGTPRRMSLGHRPQPHQPPPRRAREAGRPRAARRRRLRERRRGARGGRARRGPRGGRGRGVVLPQPGPARPHGALRRGRPRRARCAAPPRRRCGCGRPRRWASRAASCRPATSRTTSTPASAWSGSTRSRKPSSASPTATEAGKPLTHDGLRPGAILSLPGPGAEVSLPDQGTYR